MWTAAQERVQLLFLEQLIHYQILIIASSSTRVKHLSGSNFCNVKICSSALSVMSVNEESPSAEPSVETKDAILCPGKL